MDQKYDVISLGSCTMDLIFQVEDIMRMELTDRDNIVKKYVAIENSSKLNVQQVKFFPGGSAANIACDLANIGLKTAYIGGVGKDASGTACLTSLDDHHVDRSGVKIFDDATAHSVILINSQYKDRSILAYKGANDLFSEKDVPEEMLRSTRCFAWTSLTSDNGIGAIKKCIDIARKAGAQIVGAPSISIIKKRKEEAIELIKLSDITSLNDEELEALTGTRDIHAGMQQLFTWGLRLVNVTLGKDGQLLSDGKTLIKTTPPKIHVMDTTGAGDATMSGIIYGVLHQISLHKTAQIAVSLSSMEIEASGVRVGLPELFAGLESFMEAHEFIQESKVF